MRRNQFARPVEARIGETRFEFLQAVADGDVRTDDQDRVREALVVRRRGRVQDAPRRQHTHDSRLTTAGRHLERVAYEGSRSCAPGLRAGLVRGHPDASAQIRRPLDEKDQCFGRFELREEQMLTAVFTPPQSEQLARRGRGAVVISFPPGLYPFANRIDERELVFLALAGLRDQLDLFCLAATAASGVLGDAEEIARLAPALAFVRRLTTHDVPVAARRLERRIDDRRFELRGLNDRLCSAAHNLPSR